MNKKIKLLIIEDSIFMQRVINDIVNEDDQIEVIGQAYNGKEALDIVKINKPDVITLDVEMPIMDGLTCLKELKSQGHNSIIMLSSLTEKDTKTTLEALELGAIDFIQKPKNIFKISIDEKKKEIIDKIKIAANIDNNDSISKINTINPINFDLSFKNNGKLKYIIAIGTSTGGPKALQAVIPYIPENIPAAIVIVQHMPPQFTKSLSERLNSISKITVKEAEDGDILCQGMAYLAPGGKQMKVVKKRNEYKIVVDQSEPVSGHRPSVDAMMNSIVETNCKKLVAIMMTGMGRDGCDGFVKAKNKLKAYIISQDEETSIVYGMPKAVNESGIADEIVPLYNIAQRIVKAMEV